MRALNTTAHRTFNMSTTPKAKPKPKKVVEKSLTKAQVITHIAEMAELTKTQVNGVFDSLSILISKELKAGRPVSIPGLVKITPSVKAATLARPGRNPSTGEAIIIKSKPAKSVVRVRAVKALKDMVV